MSHQQNTPMLFDPATGVKDPIPNDAKEWRHNTGLAIAFLYNPWLGTLRDARDVGSDLQGFLIVPFNEPIYT